jgi:hypothetical protein
VGALATPAPPSLSTTEFGRFTSDCRSTSCCKTVEFGSEDRGGSVPDIGGCVTDGARDGGSVALVAVSDASAAT